MSNLSLLTTMICSHLYPLGMARLLSFLGNGRN